MAREFTGFFVAGYLVVLLITLGRLGGGEAARSPSGWPR